MAHRHFRIFMASPGDVTHERELALNVLDQLPYEPTFRDRITIEAVAWDKKGAGAPILANLTPQDSIARGLRKPSECDIVVVIFWARMGTPLPPKYKRKDGSTYLSGTIWEYEDAIQANEVSGKPKVLLYRRSESPSVNLDDPEHTEKYRQFLLVKDFFDSFISKDGSRPNGYSSYQSPSGFKEQLDYDLKCLIEFELRENTGSFEIGRVAKPENWSLSPFAGLRALTAQDAPIFFGRESETDALVKRLEKSNFVAVVGASGSGKSSLVGAGLIPRLQLTTGSGRWEVVTTTPDYLGSSDPFAALASSLLRDFKGLKEAGLTKRLKDQPDALVEICTRLLSKTPGVKILLFIDQFEELFTTVNPNLRKLFIEMLANASASPLFRVVATLRGDFYGKCIGFPTLAKLLEESTYPLSIPGVISLYEMITRPAARAGIEFEDELAKRILKDTGTEPGSLALMAYTLDELYRLRTNKQILTHKAYESLDGVQGAVGKRSEAIFTQLGENEQNSLPQVFRELIEVDEYGTATRQRSTLDRVAKTREARKLVRAFTDGRLLVQSHGENNEPYVEVAHEALLSNWKRLSEWIDETRNDLRLLGQVKMAAREWERNERRDDFLWSQERLEPAYVMKERLQIEFEKPLREFVQPEVDRLFEDFKQQTKYFEQKVIIHRLAEIGSSSVPVLVKALAYAHTPKARKDIHVVLQRFPKDATGRLVEVCRTGGVPTQFLCVELLGKLKRIEALDTLINMLESSDSRVRLYAIQAIYNLVENAAFDIIRDKLSDKNSEVRKMAFLVSCCAADSRVIQLCDDALDSVFDDLRSISAYFLGLIGKDPYSWVPSHFWNFADYLGIKESEDKSLPYEPIFERLPFYKGKFHKEITNSPSILKKLCALLDDTGWNVRANAAIALGMISNSYAVPFLERAKKDSEPRVRNAAMDALKLIKGDK